MELALENATILEEGSGQTFGFQVTQFTAWAKCNLQLCKETRELSSKQNKSKHLRKPWFQLPVSLLEVLVSCLSIYYRHTVYVSKHKNSPVGEKINQYLHISLWFCMYKTD